MSRNEFEPAYRNYRAKVDKRDSEGVMRPYLEVGDSWSDVDKAKHIANALNRYAIWQRQERAKAKRREKARATSDAA